LRPLGVGGVAGVIFEQFRHFTSFVLRWAPVARFSIDGAMAVPAFLPLAGLLCLPVLARRHRELALLAALSVLGCVAFLCLFYHSEVRYFFPCLPLLLLSLAFTLGRLRLVGWALGAVFLILSVSAFARLPIPGPKEDPCADIIAELPSLTAPDERILTFRPSALTWWTRREAVVVPGGGRDPILEIARRYRTRWILAEPWVFRTATARTLKHLEDHRDSALEIVTARRNQRCRLYRLDGLPQRSP
jgi:hypothetical protein